MITEFAAEHASAVLTAIVFIISFLSFIGSIFWVYLVSKNYLKKAGNLPNQDNGDEK